MQARTELRQQADALEAEVARGRQRLAQIRAEALVREERAMAAIRTGQDHAARMALVDHKGAAEEAAAIEADLRVLDAILAECYLHLEISTRPESAAAPDLAPPANER